MSSGAVVWRSPRSTWPQSIFSVIPTPLFRLRIGSAVYCAGQKHSAQRLPSSLSRAHSAHHRSGAELRGRREVDVAIETSWEALGWVVREGPILSLVGEPRTLGGHGRDRYVDAPIVGILHMRA